MCCAAAKACELQDELGTPALAFTRAVCEVLKLDVSLTDEVAILRRNLLRMTQNREFGENAAFKVSRGQHRRLSNGEESIAKILS